MNISSATPHALLKLLIASDPAQEPWFFWVDYQGEIYLEPLTTYSLNFARWEKIQGHRSKFHFGTLSPGCVGPDTRDDLALAQSWLARLKDAWDKECVGYVDADTPVGR